MTANQTMAQGLENRSDLGPNFGSRAISRLESVGQRRIRTLLSTGAWLYVAVVLGIWAAIRLGGDRWWWTTVLQYGPRWLATVPLAVLIPTAGLLNRRLLVPLILAALVVVWPVMGLCVPWIASPVVANGPRTLRIVTCNVHGGHSNPVALNSLIDETQADLVAFQEWPAEHTAAVAWPPELSPNVDGELCLASRFPLVHRATWGYAELHCRARVARWDVITPNGTVAVFVVHLKSARDGLEAVLAHGWSGRTAMESNIEQRRVLSAHVRELVRQTELPFLVVGDFNLPVESTIYRRDWAGLTNAFSAAGFGWGYTHRTRHSGVRIDHVLADGRWTITGSYVGPDVGSDHLPVVTDLSLRLEIR